MMEFDQAQAQLALAAQAITRRETLPLASLAYVAAFSVSALWALWRAGDPALAGVALLVGLFSPMVAIGSLVTGLATPTESAALTAAYESAASGVSAASNSSQSARSLRDSLLGSMPKIRSAAADSAACVSAEPWALPFALWIGTSPTSISTRSGRISICITREISTPGPA